MIQGAQLSNSFIFLMVLYESQKPLNSTEISETFASKISGKIFSLSNIKDPLEHTLKRERYVESIDIFAKKGTITPLKEPLLYYIKR